MGILILIFLLFGHAVQAQFAPPIVTFLSDEELRRAIKNAPEVEPGLYWLRLSKPSDSPVVGIRRTAPTKSELHHDFTDVWYVIEGAGILINGGDMVDGVDTAPGEVRGRAIKNGDSRRIQKGEFAVIPAGIPHWISSVEGKEILYIIVKVPIKKYGIQTAASYDGRPTSRSSGQHLC